MSVYVRCRPLDQWFGPRTRDRRSASFSASWNRTIDDLTRELEHLEARDVVIGIEADASAIRADGWPKGGRAIPPPVSLTFESRVGPLRFECDRWNDYRDNLRAIGLTLHRLRLVDEGGVARRGEQYQGWGALPPGTPMPAAKMTVEAALLVLGLTSADLGKHGTIHEAWRSAAKVAHPDRGGDPELFRQITEARELLTSEVDTSDEGQVTP